MLDSPERVCAGQAWFEYPATFVLFSNFNQTPSNPTALCFFAFTFTGKGEITGDGSLVFAPAPEGFRPVPFNLPVTGGTGIYQNARGQIHVEFLGVADARFTFHLIP
jgi:hypothetical protein